MSLCNMIKGIDLRPPNPKTFKVGDVIGGDYLQIENDGTWINNGDGTTFDEISRNLFGARLDTTSGRISYNFTELTVDFASNARYPEEVVNAVIQTPHAWKLGGGVFPHLHWVQNQDAVPNILIAYRAYNNGEAVPASWTLKPLTSANLVFTYPGSGNFLQITTFDLDQSLFTDKTISFTFDCKIYRDVGNTSGLFAGGDPYTGTWSTKYYDIHFERDTNGSREEYIK